jgi:hypothetical protein
MGCRKRMLSFLIKVRRNETPPVIRGGTFKIF